MCGKLVVRAQMATHVASACSGPARAVDAARVGDSKLDDDEAGLTVAEGTRAVLSTLDRDGFEAAMAVDEVPRTRREVQHAPVAAHAAATAATLAVAAGLPGASRAAPRTAIASARSTASHTTPARLEPAVGGVAAASARVTTSVRRDAYPCPHCNKRCPDYEALQMHVFTECQASGEVPLAAPPAAVAPSTRPAGRPLSSSRPPASTITEAAPKRAGSSRALTGAASVLLSSTSTGSGATRSGMAGGRPSSGAAGIAPPGTRSAVTRFK